MALRPVSKTSFLVIEYDDHQGFLYLKWKGYLTVDQIKQGCELVLRAVHQLGCSKIIDDNREVLGSWTQAIPWLASHFLPRMLKVGIEKIAFIYQPYSSAGYSVERFLELSDQYHGQTFETLEEAYKWLNAPSAELARTLPSPRQQLVIRQQEKTCLLPFEEIYYLSSDSGDTFIQTKKASYTSKEPLKELLIKLPGEMFIRIHRSHVINIREISHLKYHAGGSYLVFLRDLPKVKIPVSRSYAADLKRRLGLSGLDD